MCYGCQGRDTGSQAAGGAEAPLVGVYTLILGVYIEKPQPRPIARDR